MTSLRFVLPLSLALAVLPACSTYTAKPLDKGAVEAALAPQPIESVKDLAGRFKHPIVQAMAIDGRDGFTPDEIALMVVISSPQLKALRAQRGVAEAQVIQAGILPNPQLGYAFDKPHGNDDPTLVASKSLGLSWDVTSLLTYRDQVAAAKASARSLDLSVAWQEWQAAQDARLRAYRILSLTERLPLQVAVEKELDEATALTRKAVELGHRTLPDLTSLTETSRQARNARYDIEQQLSAERSALALSLGLPPGSPVPLKGAGSIPDLALAAGSPAGLLEGLEERRLDLVALRYGYDSQEASLRSAVIAQFPKIGLSVNRAQDTTPVKTLGYAVAVDLPLFDRNQGAIAVGKATREQVFDEYVARVAEARASVGQILDQVAIVHRQLDEVALTLSDLGRSATAFDAALRERTIDVQASRDAHAALLAHQIEQSQLRQQALELGVALEIATGRTLLGRDPNPKS